MNKTTKKIIAREFLILLAMAILGGLLVLCVFPYNAIKQNRINDLVLKEVQLKNNIDSLGAKALEKQKKNEWYYKKLGSEFNFEKPPYTKINTFWTRIKTLAEKDSLKEMYSDKWSEKVKKFHSDLGFKNGDEFQNFVINNSLTKSDSIDLIKTDKLKTELNKIIDERYDIESEKVSENHHIDIAGGIFLALFIIMFLMRYLFYAIKWSFRILKTEE